MTTLKTTHYTNFGVRMQPPEADGAGFLAYREGYERLPREEWTPAEECGGPTCSSASGRSCCCA